MNSSRVVASAVAGLLAACAVVTPAHAAQRTVCNRYCDGRDPALAPGQRVPVVATISGRTIRLLFDDADAMGWASIDDGGAGDQVWLDRSFTGGRTWSDGGKLGVTAVPPGYTGWRTAMFNVDDWYGHGVGALRACGRTAASTATACTPWARTT